MLETVGMVSLLHLVDKYLDLNWYTTHGVCDPRPRTGDYRIDVAGLRTLAQVSRRNADFARKRWIVHTQRPEFLVRSLGQPTGG
jgi:hypothetical protein